MAELVNNLHDVLIDIFKNMGLQLSDKDLHFWIIGVIGIFTFFFVLVLFKWVSKLKWSVTAFSFIYTFTIMVVLVFAIEIQQAITNRGNMEFADAVMGLYGFLFFFLIYGVFSIVYYLISKFRRGKR
jgi:zinc transporter ZupT